MNTFILRAGRNTARSILLAALAGVLAGLAPAGAAASEKEKAPAASPYTPFKRVCPVTDKRLDEVSGIAASRRNPGLFYVHNDSKGKPWVYAVDRKGTVVAVIELANTANRDWEDIALAPGRSKGVWDVCVADTGDNRRQRMEVEIYRFPEPDLQEARGSRVRVEAERYPCTFPDGPHDVEAFVVDPGTGEGYLITKSFEGNPGIYRLGAWRRDRVHLLAYVDSLPIPGSALPPARIVTGADLSPDGTRLVVRTYVCAWEWIAASGTGRLSRFFTRPPALLALAPEPQGEAICYAPDERALLTMSEGSPTALFEARRKAKPSRKRDACPGR